jgi:biotin carboxylase
MTTHFNKTIDAPVILVDAYSTGAILARRLAQQYPCLHVCSRQAMPTAFRDSCPRDVFAAELQPEPSGFPALVAKLLEYRPSAVIAASEFGVELADQLAAALGLPGNSPRQSAARRDKFRMAEAVAAAGLPVAAQFESGELAALLAWYRQQPTPAIVVKPLDSAGSDNVYLCRNEAQLQHAVTRILGTTNLMMRDNQQVLLQHYLEGDEYVINSVSHAGRHWVSDVWCCSKTLSADGRKIYDHEDLQAPDEPRLASILEYVQGVLDALGIAYGPAHTEIILTAAGPRLLETGARISGLANPLALTAATGADQVELTVACHTQPARLEDYPRLYRRVKQARCVNLIARRPVRLLHSAVREFLSDRASFESVRFRVADGGEMTPTVDLNSSPGALFLVHADAAQIEQDYRAFRQWEQQNL